MCGIAGMFRMDAGAAVHEAELAPLMRALRHRGPDDEGVFADGGCGLVHTRLSILDLSARAKQPMRSASGRYWLSYNGEIYNYRELRAELRQAGRTFRSDGDSEVILQLIEQGGIAALHRLEGMFAFAAYDTERRELVLMRDRLGIKPLFWILRPERLCFASEPKALGASRERPPPARLAEYLAFRHVAGEESLQPEILTLPPGHRLVTDGRGVKVERWWQAPGRLCAASGPQATARIDDPQATAGIVAAAVQRQLVSDVPVGVFLSGGVDSAAVSAAAAGALPNVETFSVGFHEAAWDETGRAAQAAHRLHTPWHVLRLTASEYASGLGEAIWHLDAPLNHAHSVHLLALARFARAHIKVALTGEGGDELFAGYPRYRLFLLGRALRWLPGSGLRAAGKAVRASRPRWARLLEAARRDAAGAAAVNAAFVPVEDAARLVGLEQAEAALAARRALFEAARGRGLAEMESLLALERETYLVSLLQRMDRMSMAVGLECRVPLLDERVVEHAAALPIHARIDLLETKKPMRRLAAQRFGAAYAYAPKSGFGVPLDAWLRGDGLLACWLARLLEERRTLQRGWLDVKQAGRLLAEHRSGAGDHTEMLWGVLNLELWARICLDGDGPEGARA